MGANLADCAIQRLDVRVCTIPTDFPEQDGTLSWDKTTVVIVEASAGGRSGIGFSYAGKAAAVMIQQDLAGVVVGRDAMAVPGSWQAMVKAVRNLGRPNALGGKKDAPSMKRFDDAREEKMVWQIRESGLGATARVPGEKDTWPGWEDSAVRPENLGRYLRDLRGLLEKYEYKCSLYGHFGQGCVHTRIDFDLLTRRGIDRYRAFVYEAADLVLKYGGSFSGEHGDGQSRAELLPKMFGPELVEAFREFKHIWDPDGRMNPGKVVDPYRIDANLRLGTAYNPPALSTRFHYSEDHNSLAYATLRCVGVGKCRNVIEGTMCPSYMGTLEEMHSTRGRARMLFEMVQGEVVTGGWRDRHVNEALLGLDYHILDSGCCGISGAFGFRKNNYEFSNNIGERVLLPAVRAAAKNTLIIADGFSCREQIVQSTDREALHLSQVLCMAMDLEKMPLGDYPERRYLEHPRRK